MALIPSLQTQLSQPHSQSPDPDFFGCSKKNMHTEKKNWVWKLGMRPTQGCTAGAIKVNVCGQELRAGILATVHAK